MHFSERSTLPVGVTADGMRVRCYSWSKLIFCGSYTGNLVLWRNL